MFEKIKNHFKRYWKYYLLALTFPAGFGIYVGAFAGVSGENTLSPISPESPQSACSLEIDPQSFQACQNGMKAGYKLGKGKKYPSFNQLDDACREYYPDANLTSSCLNGLVTGAQGQLQIEKDQRAFKKETSKNNLRNAGVAAFGSILFFSSGWFLGSGKYAPENEENRENKPLLTNEV